LRSKPFKIIFLILILKKGMNSKTNIQHDGLKNIKDLFKTYGITNIIKTDKSFSKLERLSLVHITAFGIRKDKRTNGAATDISTTPTRNPRVKKYTINLQIVVYKLLSNRSIAKKYR